MLNPISNNKSYLLAFLVVWIVIFGIHTFVINFFYDVDTIASFADSAIFNLLIALIGFNLWYVIRFNMRDTATAFDMVINHLIIAVVIISIWVAASYFILAALFKENTNYVQFLNDSLPWRAVLGIFFYLIFIMKIYRKN